VSHQRIMTPEQQGYCP